MNTSTDHANCEYQMLRDLLPCTIEGAVIDAIVRNRISGELPDLTTTDLPPGVQRWCCILIGASEMRSILTSDELALAEGRTPTRFKIVNREGVVWQVC
jgi:hypothetical protein